MSEELMIVPEAEALLRVGRDKIYEMCRTGEIPSVRLGRQIRIPRAALLRYLEQKSEVAVSDA